MTGRSRVFGIAYPKTKTRKVKVDILRKRYRKTKKDIRLFGYRIYAHCRRQAEKARALQQCPQYKHREPESRTGSRKTYSKPKDRIIQQAPALSSKMSHNPGSGKNLPDKFLKNEFFHFNSALLRIKLSGCSPTGSRGTPVAVLFYNERQPLGNGIYEEEKVMKALCAVLCLVALALFAGCSHYQPGYYSHYGARGSFPGTGCSSCVK